MSYKSKNLYNATLYAVRQHFFKTSEYLNYYSTQKQFQNSKQFDYNQLPAKVSLWVMKMVDQNFRSFFKALKSYKVNPEKFTGRPKLPKYLDKEKGRYLLTFTSQAISHKALKNNVLKLSGLDIELKLPNLPNKINQVRIVKRPGFYVIEIVYTIKEVDLKQDNQRYASIDLGINNLATITTNVSKPFIINGKPLKSINQFYNKKRSELQSKQNSKYAVNSRKLRTLTNKRNNKVKDYLHKASRLIVNYLIESDINTLVIGKNKYWKQEIKIRKVNNQNFVMIPHTQFIDLLKYKCTLAGINLIIQEESYTSKASFLDRDYIPVYKKNSKTKHVFSGKRIHRGLYKSSKGSLINADVNGSLNILRKAVSNVNFINEIEACSTPLVKTIK